jgi:hypothetical protein
MQTYLDVWAQSRAGKKIQRIFKSRLRELQQRKNVYQQGDFLWPKKSELDFLVRVNTDTDSRSIDEIPKEELAKAMAIILDEGGIMTKDDLILETTRLIGYQRRGPRIKERLTDAIKILEQIGAVSENTDGKYQLNSDVDIDVELLRRIYT